MIEYGSEIMYSSKLNVQENHIYRKYTQEKDIPEWLFTSIPNKLQTHYLHEIYL